MVAQKYANRYLMLVLACLLLTAGDARARGQTRDKDLADVLLAGLRNHMEPLDSGIVEFEVLGKGGVLLAKRFVAFDARNERVRCDLLKSLNADRVVKVVHTKTEFLQHLERQQTCQLIRLNPGEESRVADGMPIDMHAVGLCSYQTLARGGTLAGVWKAFDKAKLVKASLEGDIGVVVMDPSYDAGRTQIVYWIDTAHGYIPLRREVRLPTLLGGSVASQRYEVEWARLKGTMIPLRSSLLRPPRPGAVLERVEEMRFTWKSVNEEIPKELFAVENLKLREGAYVIDTRLGQPIVEEVIGMDRPLPAVPAPREFTWATTILIAVSVALLLAFGVLAVARRRRGKAASSPHGGHQ